MTSKTIERFAGIPVVLLSTLRISGSKVSPSDYDFSGEAIEWMLDNLPLGTQIDKPLGYGQWGDAFLVKFRGREAVLKFTEDTSEANCIEDIHHGKYKGNEWAPEVFEFAYIPGNMGPVLDPVFTYGSPVSDVGESRRPVAWYIRKPYMTLSKGDTQELFEKMNLKYPKQILWQDEDELLDAIQVKSGFGDAHTDNVGRDQRDGHFVVFDPQC